MWMPENVDKSVPDALLQMSIAARERQEEGWEAEPIQHSVRGGESERKKEERGRKKEREKRRGRDGRADLMGKEGYGGGLLTACGLGCIANSVAGC